LSTTKIKGSIKETFPTNMTHSHLTYTLIELEQFSRVSQTLYIERTRLLNTWLSDSQYISIPENLGVPRNTTVPRKPIIIRPTVHLEYTHYSFGTGYSRTSDQRSLVTFKSTLKTHFYQTAFCMQSAALLPHLRFAQMKPF